jgi:glutathione synthase/RimK-type ligase-like ATP-grasp enzyme
MAILFVSGVNDLSTVSAQVDDNGRLSYLLDGNCKVQQFLPLKDGAAASFVIFGKAVQQHSIVFKTPPSVIFNQIAEPDTHRGALERCVELCEQTNAPIINHPRKVLETTRDRVSEALQGIPGLTVPRTLRFHPRSPDEVFSRAAAEDIDFPFIARMAGPHGGVGMVKVDSPDDHASLHAFPFDGRAFYLTEFIDYKSADGLHRKTRVAMVDGVPLIRHHLMDASWKVHASSRAFMDQHPALHEEANAGLANFDQVLRPIIEDRLTEIYRRLGLDYFGVDCHVDEQGKMLLFEANAYMNIIFNSRKVYEQCVGAIKDSILAMIEERAHRVTH